MMHRSLFHKSWRSALRLTTNNNIIHRTLTSSSSSLKVAVVGSGSFGSAMVQVLSWALQQHQQQQHDTNTHHQISWYARRQSIVDEINQNRTNRQYFEGGTFHPSLVTATNRLDECVRDARVVVLAVPSAYLTPILHQLHDDNSSSSLLLHPDAVVCSVLKSLTYDPSTRTMTTAADKIQQHLQHRHPVVVLSGPNLYKEMLGHQHANETFAEATIGYDHNNHDDMHHQSLEAARLVQRVTSSPSFVTSLWHDRVGVEWCGGLKNVLSLGTGYCEALQLGWNGRAALWRAGMHEMVRLMRKLQQHQQQSSGGHVVVVDPEETVFTTSAGVGDLILTCAAGRGRLLAKAFVEEGMQMMMQQKESDDGRKSSFLSSSSSSSSLLQHDHDDDDYESWSVARWEALETSLLNGMKLPDWHNARQVHQALTDLHCVDQFPLLEAIYQIGFQGKDPRYMVEALSRSIRLAAAPAAAQK